jgi:hypothetical protein
VEWPLFAAFGMYFWIKSLRDELRPGAPASDEPGEDGRPAEAASRSGAGPTRQPSDPDVAMPGDGEAYAARLKAEVQRHGRWHGLR